MKKKTSYHQKGKVLVVPQCTNSEAQWLKQ